MTASFGWHYPAGTTYLPGEQDYCSRCEDEEIDGECPHPTDDELREEAALRKWEAAREERYA